MILEISTACLDLGKFSSPTTLVVTNEVLDLQSRSALASIALPFGDVTNHSVGTDLLCVQFEGT